MGRYLHRLWPVFFISFIESITMGVKGSNAPCPMPEPRLPMLDSRRPKPRNRFRTREALGAVLFLFPAGVILLAFHILPIFYAFFISLHQWGLIREEYVGLANYRELAADAEFRHSLGVTVWFVLGTVPLGIAVSLALALLLFGELRARGFFRTLYFLPYVTSVVAAALAWSWIYNPQYGILNYLLAKGGLPTQRWLLEPTGVFQMALGGVGIQLPVWAQGPSLVLVSIMAMTVWNTLGFNIVIFLAGLGGVSRELQEAARIDGAGDFGVFRHVTWPLLTPITFFLLIVNTIRAFQAFNQIYVMTQPDPGGPLDTTQVVTVYIFKTFYERTDMGYGAAMAFGLLLIILILTLLQFRIAKERVTYG